MSSFPGRMKEYPAISLDRFDRENLHAKAYFLSHCHKDHMKGLKGPLLKRKLKFSLTVKLYCSFVTKELLLNNPKYAFWEDHIVPLELDSPSRISLTDETSGETEDVVVTLLTAGHCPGSVMFLFEGSQGTVLYTGDFRLAVGDAARMEGLHSGDRVKDIRSVYIDSTFFDPKYHQIPTREACLAGIRQLVQDWICRSPYHVVWLNCKAAYGYEYLFTNLGLEFSSQIHVNSLEMFKKMPDILCHMTTNRATQIHACRHPKDEELFRANRLPCGSMASDGVPLNIISIKPSTIWFGERTRKTSVIAKMGGSSYRACFSFHSSYTEVKDFLSYINPVYIYPNVIPLGKTLEDVTELLKPFCRNHGDDREMIYKPLGTLKRTRKRCASEGSDSDDLFDDISMTPRRHKMLANATNDVVSGQPAQTKAQSKDSDVEETNQLFELRPLAQISNYTDCTESNDDDEEDEDDDLNLLPADTPFTTLNSDPFQTKSAPLCWDRFFKTEPAITDESEIENSQTLSSANTGSQSPFKEDEDNSSVQNSSQSTHISDAGSEILTDTILFQQRDCTSVVCDQMKTDSIRDGTTKAGLMVSALSSCSDEPEEAKPDSQISSDFELPPTPGSKIPHPEDLRVLYRKLAAGEELISGEVC